MATKLQYFDFEQGYNWQQWCDGGIWELHILKDFNNIENLYQSCRYQAKRRSCTLKFKNIDGKKVVLQFVPHFCNHPIPLEEIDQ